jgi:nitronate monooxygenase
VTIWVPWRDRLRLPVIAAPMFLVSGIDLVLAQCKAGIVGSFPALNARPARQLDEWLRRVAAEIGDAPYAVNLIVHKSNARLGEDLAICVRHRVPLVITSLSPPGDVVAAVHAYGGLVFHDVISLRHARKAIASGVDGLILVSAGAGGHAGRLSPFALLGEVRRIFAGPIVLAGAIATGDAVLAARALGADFAYVGTRFIATREANAPAAYKQMVLDCKAEDIVYTDVPSGIHGNYMAPSLSAAGLEPDKLQRADSSAGYTPKDQRAKAWRDIWSAGQGVGSVDDIPDVAGCVARLEREYREAFDRLCADATPAPAARLAPAG